MANIDMKELKRRMEGALESLHKEFTGLRTGRASTSLLEHVMVEAYGNRVPVSNVASINAPESRLLTVQVWDGSQTKAVVKAIRDAGLGLNPMEDGNTVRVPIPELNEERRIEMTKVASKYAESARIAVRNIRRDGMDAVKIMEKDGDISKDELKAYTDDIQKLTDDNIKKIDENLAKKEIEIKQV